MSSPAMTPQPPAGGRDILIAAEKTIYQVEWMSRPDEADHIKRLVSFAAAKKLAKDMSDKHDGSSVLIAIAPDYDPDHPEFVLGHIDYSFGIEVERAGCFAKQAAS